MQAEQLSSELKAVLNQGAAVRIFDPVAFCEHLRFLYHIIRATTPLLVLAAEVSDGTLRDYYLRHSGEESNHDEWLYEDLRSAGIQPFPCPTVASQLAGSQYYHLAHTSPVSLLGYMMVLEGFPLPLDVVDELELAYGRELLRTVRYHAEHDPDHSRELHSIVDGLSQSDFAIVRQIALEVAAQLTNAAQQLPRSV